jgi:hypothetical protein
VIFGRLQPLTAGALAAKPLPQACEVVTMMEIPEEVLYDRRLAERYITKGILTRAQHEEYLRNLPDAKELGESFRVGGGDGSDHGRHAGHPAPARPEQIEE